jgi:cathepsin L
LLLIALVYSRTAWHELHSYTFEKYQAEFQRKYTSEELPLRQAIFERKLDTIRRHNSDLSKTWKAGVNEFTDRTDQEFGARLGLKKSLLYKHHAESLNVERPQPVPGPLPLAVDWRDKGIVTPVKDQGQCGSCWTFATAELTESYWAMATGKLNILSEQQILDCTPNPNHCGGTGGCEGGTAELAWARITEMGGLSSEWTYPYTSYYGTDFTCQQNQLAPIAKVSKYVNLPVNEQGPMLTYLATSGPLAISVDASTWSSYETGVYNSCNQTNPDLDHAVMLVGYGTDAQLGDYWIVRNSWSPQWGEEGYIRLNRESTVQCGTDISPSDGDGCSNGPPTVTVCGTCGILFDGVYPTVSP